MLQLLLGRVLMKLLAQNREAPPTDQIVSAPEQLVPEVTLHNPVEFGDTSQSMAAADGYGAATPLIVHTSAMASEFGIQLADPTAEGAAYEALAEIERLDRQLSHYRADSDIARLNGFAGKGWVRIEPRLFALIARCKALWEATDGAFDITAGPLVKLWGFYSGRHRVPEDQEIADTLTHVGMQHVELDAAECMVRFGVEGVELDLGAIGKGYALDEAAATLRVYSVECALLDGGNSSQFALGAPPGCSGWRVPLRNPQTRDEVVEPLILRNQGFATSGSYLQQFEQNGKMYGHILDPRTGHPIQGVLSVSVAAPTAEEADALATAFFVMSPAAVRRYCATRPELSVIILLQAEDGNVSVERIETNIQ